jgi:hypothetical protein
MNPATRGETLVPSDIPADLIDAYRAAEYRIDLGEEVFSLHLQEHSPELARLLAESGQRCALFMTAYNPRSEVHDPGANHAAHVRLRTALEPLAAQILEGVGLDPSGSWPAEPGYLALGVEREAAAALGRQFGQNAVVWSGADAVSKLILLR